MDGVANQSGGGRDVAAKGCQRRRVLLGSDRAVGASDVSEKRWRQQRQAVQTVRELSGLHPHKRGELLR